MPKEKTQPDMRRRFNNRDQHGRMWLVTIEIESGDPTGAIEACFSAPIIPPPQHIKVPQDAPRTVYIDYDAWIRELEVQRKEWEMQRVEIRRRLVREEMHLLDEFAGPAPLDPRVVQMARDGNKALLGFEREWTLKVSPEEYLESHPDGPNAMLARVILGWPLELSKEEPAGAGTGGD